MLLLGYIIARGLHVYTAFTSMTVVFSTCLQVTLPVYLNSTRSELLFTLDFKAEGVTSSADHHFYERGVALLSSAL